MISILKYLYRYIFWLLFLDVLLLGTGFFLISAGVMKLSYSDISILSVLFSVITIIALLIFFRGQTKEPSSQVMHTITSISLKFLLELGLAFIWFFIAKKKSLSSLLGFFILYLSLTLFLIGVILKTLKNRSL